MSNIRKMLLIFSTGFLQVALVVAQTWLISHGELWSVLLIGFLISLVWSINVKKIAFGGWLDRFLYASGAGLGSVVGLLIAQKFVR